ncbi:prolyl oligopeptidase family serine peptidase [Streptomyces phaeochromogenes]|uniref:alpha/beta hydrolase family protein n=1 Tax=Streptomyces phaeochromogenes TaxID=1923 RepID=UPI00386C11B1|nr:prolyl oligopeptidase family serine peptidase [Streptomyces phaeochromogenes]
MSSGVASSAPRTGLGHRERGWAGLQFRRVDLHEGVEPRRSVATGGDVFSRVVQGQMETGVTDPDLLLGYADPDRVAILGGSYGGYAALVGVTFTPDVFAAAVDIFGVSDLANFLRNQPEFVRPALAANWFRWVGDPADPQQEADMLARSPISRVDQVRTPLLIAQGANDARVAQAESDNMVQALRARGVPVEYILMADEGHSIENPENLIAVYHAVERFLDEHLGHGRDAT